MTPDRKTLTRAANVLTLGMITVAFCFAIGLRHTIELIGTLPFLIGMAVTTNQVIQRKTEGRGVGPIAASTTLYEGTLAFWNSSGNLVDVTGSGANRFAGVAVENYNNSAGSAGDLSAELFTEGTFLLTGSGFSQASVGQAAYATDNYTIAAAPSANGVYIGRIVAYHSTTRVWVTIDVQGYNRAFRVQTHTADKTITVRENGSVFANTGASGTITFTLPPAVPGLLYGFRVGVAQQLRIDPDGTETISLPSNGVPGAAGKYLVADAIGETVLLQCVTAGSWSVFGFTGTWTAEP